MIPDPPSRRVQSVETTFEIVSSLQNLGSATPSQLADELDLSKSSIHNYLATLETEGYVVNEGGTYQLGLRFLTHGVAAKKRLGIRDRIATALESISGDVAYPAWWIAEELGRGFFLEGSIPDGRSSTYGDTGKRSHLHTHAPGKAILAESADEYVERVVDTYGLPEQTMKTTTDAHVLFEEVEDVRDRGFAVSDGEAVLGILSVGAAFRDGEGGVHAIGVFANSRDSVGNRAENIGETLVDFADLLEGELRTGES